MNLILWISREYPHYEDPQGGCIRHPAAAGEARVGRVDGRAQDLLARAQPCRGSFQKEDQHLVFKAGKMMKHVDFEAKLSFHQKWGIRG